MQNEYFQCKYFEKQKKKIIKLDIIGFITVFYMDIQPIDIFNFANNKF